MRIPDSLAVLVDFGTIDRVVRPLMSGKEAQVYLVESEGELRVAKIYKEAQNRSFRHRSEYTEGRRVRNSRDQRAMRKRTTHGRAREEAAWRSAEVDIIYRLQHAGVRVPVPYAFIEGVLVMELVCDADGNPAQRLGDVRLPRERAREVFDRLLREVVRMLCAGVVHGDFSEFNVLLGADGPVVIDFPQAVDPSSNLNARRLLIRDVANLNHFLGAHGGGRPLPYAQEMWALYEAGELTPETELKGVLKSPKGSVDTGLVLSEIADAAREARPQQRRRGTPCSSHATARPPRIQ